MPDNAPAPTAAPIVLGVPDDLAALVQLKQTAYEPWIAIVGRQPLPYAYDYVPALAEGRVHVMRGPAGLQAALVVERPENALLIFSIAVDPALQRRGLARHLLAFAEDLARSEGRSEMRLYTNVLMTRNIALYAALGYVDVGREEVAPGFHRVNMAKPLS